MLCFMKQKPLSTASSWRLLTVVFVKRDQDTDTHRGRLWKNPASLNQGEKRRRALLVLLRQTGQSVLVWIKFLESRLCAYSQRAFCL